MEHILRQRPFEQKTIGILGGCSNVATGVYYRVINEESNARLGGWDIAETLIVGMNFGNIEFTLRQEQWDIMQAYMTEKIDRLIAADVDLLLCASNTLHMPLSKIMADRDTPWIHIADPTGRAIRDAGLKRVLLLGTRSVMQLDYLKDYYGDHFGLDIVVPNDSEQDEIDGIIFRELVKDRVVPESKQRALEIADRMVRDVGAECLVMGCTEICLLLEQGDRPDMPMFDTTRLHCEAAVEMALAGSTSS